MRRHRIAVLGLAALALTGAVRGLPASADDPAPPPPPLPRYPCSHGVTDAQGDAAPQYVSGQDTSAVFPNEPALDVRAVNIQLTDDQLQVFMALDGVIDPANMSLAEPAWRYFVTFKFGDHTFTYGYEVDNPGGALKDQGLGPEYGDAHPAGSGDYPEELMDGDTDLSPNSTADLEAGNGTTPSWIVFTTPREDIEDAIGDGIDPGQAFTDIVGSTQEWVKDNSYSVDTTTASAAQATYVVGLDDCFGPPPTTVRSLRVSAAQWSDTSTLSAVLFGDDGKPLADEPVSFTVADGKPTVVTATTDSSGRVAATYGPIRVKAGSYPVTAQFPGDDANKASQATGTLKVVAEKTAFKALQVTRPSATRRVVTATLLDDDRHPVAGAAVTWWVNGKKVARGETDRRGTVRLRTAKPGQTVQARYAGSSGTLLGAASRRVKV